jgi:hypothetical protein
LLPKWWYSDPVVVLAAAESRPTCTASYPSRPKASSAASTSRPFALAVDGIHSGIIDSQHGIIEL